MTDKDVIIIEGCIKGEKVLCLSCPYRDQYPDCRKYVIRDIFEVANRQKAEIERLQVEIIGNYQTMKQALVLVDKLKQDIAIDIVTAKTEAIKEFAERLKHMLGLINGFDYDCSTIFYHIDNLVKEMVGAESG